MHEKMREHDKVQKFVDELWEKTRELRSTNK